MNELQIFSYDQNEIRMIMQEDGLWWVLADVCKVLELKEPHRVAARLDDDEKGRTLMTTLGGPQEMTIINESGLYSVILRSDKPEAKAFKRWITHEVLPSIRRTGSYQAPVSEAELLVRLAQANLAQERRISVLEQRVVAPVPPAAETKDLPTGEKGFMDSVEIARILGRDHNNVLKGIRATIERARSEGVPVDNHFALCHRVPGLNLRWPYYRLNETAISMFSQNLKDWTLAEKLRAAFREKNTHLIS